MKKNPHILINAVYRLYTHTEMQNINYIYNIHSVITIQKIV